MPNPVDRDTDQVARNQLFLYTHEWHEADPDVASHKFLDRFNRGDLYGDIERSVVPTESFYNFFSRDGTNIVSDEALPRQVPNMHQFGSGELMTRTYDQHQLVSGHRRPLNIVAFRQE